MSRRSPLSSFIRSLSLGVEQRERLGLDEIFFTSSYSSILPRLEATGLDFRFDLGESS